MVGGQRCWRGLAVVSLILCASGFLGCQAGFRSLASLSDECAQPTPANRDWCLSIQFPNAE